MIEIATVNYAAYKPEMGLAVRTSVGPPKYFEHVKAVQTLATQLHIEIVPTVFPSTTAGKLCSS